jgi:hypothetical protein
MAETPFESERPPDEIWWERELNRNEKLIDKYMAVLGDDPDWEKWKDPDDLYNKVHFNIDPPETSTKDKTEEPDGVALPGPEEIPDEVPDEEDKNETNDDDAAFIDAMNAASALSDDDDEFDDEPPNNEDYPAIAKKARKFAVSVLRFEDIPDEDEVVYLSAGKVGANLAGGNGLGYDDDSICGNIVKCRWALADCEFCREMLGHLHQRTGRAEYADLHQQAQELSAAIQDRITRLRARVWW